MERCNAWHVFDSGRAVCFATKEMDVCDCGGDMGRCNFYPEKRRKQIESQKVEMTKFEAESKFNIKIVND